MVQMDAVAQILALVAMSSSMHQMRQEHLYPERRIVFVLETWVVVLQVSMAPSFLVASSLVHQMPPSHLHPVEPAAFVLGTREVVLQVSTVASFFAASKSVQTRPGRGQ